MYNMDNQNMINMGYQHQYAQYNNNNQQFYHQPQFNNNNNTAPPQATNMNVNVNPSGVGSGFNLNAQTFIPATQPTSGPPQSAQPPITAPLQPLPQQPLPSTQPTHSYMYNPNNVANEANILKEKLQRRLAQDIEDFQKQLSNFPNFNAMPLKDKIEEWHFNVWPAGGIYADCCIHGVIQFPTEYPQKPPTIELSVPIPHLNVKSISSKAWVSLDILSGIFMPHLISFMSYHLLTQNHFFQIFPDFSTLFMYYYNHYFFCLLCSQCNEMNAMNEMK